MSSANPKKIGENHYQIDADSNLGMKVPVRIYANETLLQKMFNIVIDYDNGNFHLSVQGHFIRCSIQNTPP